MDWTVQTALMEHQIRACEKLIRSKIGALFMEPGTGKTRTAIEFAYRRKGKYDKIVWICPDNVKSTIAYEWRKHTSLDDEIYVWDDKTTDATIPPALVHIVGLEGISMSTRVALALNSVVTDQTFMIVDESARIKNHKALRTQRISLIGERAKYKLILTGTPTTSSGAEDLFSQMTFLSHKILGYRSFYGFAANHLEYNEKFKKYSINAHNTALIASKIAPYVYQVRKSECLQLPEKVYQTEEFELSVPQWQAYTSAKKLTFEALEELEDNRDTSYLIFRMFSWLRQIVSGFWNHPEHGLIEYPNTRLMALEQVLTDKKTIIWVEYQKSVEDIVQLLGRSQCSLFYGGISKAERDTEIALWRKEKPYLIATPATGGEGLTLNEAEQVVFFSNSFSYEKRQQAEDRCHRQGQTKQILYTDLVAVGTIDERMRDAQYRKFSYAQDLKRTIAAVKDMKKKDAIKVLKKMIDGV